MRTRELDTSSSKRVQLFEAHTSTGELGPTRGDQKQGLNGHALVMRTPAVCRVVPLRSVETIGLLAFRQGTHLGTPPAIAWVQRIPS